MVRGIFILLLSFLLPKGYDYLYAHTSQHGNYHATVKISEKQTGTALICRADGADIENDGLQAAEWDDDDDDAISSRKFVKIVHCGSFYELCDIQWNVRNSYPVSGHYPYTASCKYILQRAIRV
jgi:hypothetical protein